MGTFIDIFHMRPSHGWGNRGKWHLFQGTRDDISNLKGAKTIRRTGDSENILANLEPKSRGELL